MFNLDRLADRTTAASVRVRLIDVASVLMWLTAIALMIVSTVDESASVIGRWGLLVGMMALAGTLWSVATWIVEVMRLEFEITKLRQIHPSRRVGNE
jgi:hypothetical protein